MEEISKTRFTDMSKQAFTLMKRMLKYNAFEKRDGGFMEKALVQGRMVWGQELDELVIENYKKIHCSVPNIEMVEFPELKISSQQAQRLIRTTKKNKAISFDYIDQELFILDCKVENKDKCVKCLRKIQLVKELVENYEFWRSGRGNQHLVGRLIALNKVFPLTPKIQQYRPIVVLSCIVKILQGLIRRQLVIYNKTLHKQQFGFRSGLSIQECKVSVFNEIQKRRLGNNMLVFIDLKSAYDRIDRNILVDIIKSKNILSDNMLKLLKFLWCNNYTKCGKYSTFLTNGVNQGSTISPFLFNIYIEQLGERLRKQNIYFRLYADDLIIIGNNEQCRTGIRTVKQWCLQRNMEMSTTKSGVLPLKTKKSEVQFQGIPVVEKYKYLGLVINGNLEPSSHLTMINKKISFIMLRLFPLRALDDLKLNRNLFLVFILPVYRLYMSGLSYASDTQKKKIITHLKVKIKIFTRLPVNMSDDLFKIILGDLPLLMNLSLQKVKMKLKAFEENKVIEIKELDNFKIKWSESKGARFLPKKITELTRNLYKSKCEIHKEKCLTTTHMNESHLAEWKQFSKNNLPFSIIDLIISYQQQKARPTIRSKITASIDFIKLIAKAHGGKRGRRWNSKSKRKSNKRVRKLQKK